MLIISLSRNSANWLRKRGQPIDNGCPRIRPSVSRRKRSQSPTHDGKTLTSIRYGSFEPGRLFVGFDHVARLIENANQR